MSLSALDHQVGATIGVAQRPVDREVITAWQEERLQATLAHCRRRSAFYQRKYAALDPHSVRGMADLHRLPLTTETELRQFGQAMVCVSQDQVARIVTLHSSGTTGNPKRLWFTEADLERTLDFFHLGMVPLVAPGQRVAILLPGPTPDSTGHLLAQALTRLPAFGRIFGLVSDPEPMLRTLAEWQPHVLVGFPVQILALARMAVALALPLGPIRSVLLCSDYVPVSLEASLGELLQCAIFTHYGTTETGLGGGVDCTAHCGSHLREADLLFEIIDPRTTQPLADGLWGEIVCTTLTREGMPLLRYRTGDQGRLLADPCPCGSRIRRLDRVRGRRQQIRRLRSGAELALADLDEWLFAIPGLLDFSARLVTDRGQDRLQLELTVLPGWGNEVRALAFAALERRPDLHQLALSLTLNTGTTIHPGKRLLEEYREDTSP